MKKRNRNQTSIVIPGVDENDEDQQRDYNIEPAEDEDSDELSNLEMRQKRPMMRQMTRTMMAIQHSLPQRPARR